MNAESASVFALDMRQRLPGRSTGGNMPAIASRFGWGCETPEPISSACNLSEYLEKVQPFGKTFKDSELCTAAFISRSTPILWEARP